MVDANQALEERLDKHGSRLYRLENQDIPNQVSKVVDEIVTDAVDWDMQAPLRERFRDLPKADMKEILHNRIDQLLSDLAEARKKKKKRQGLPKTLPGSPPHPPPPPPPLGGQSTSTAAPSSSKTVALAEYTAWTITGTRLKPFVSLILKELHMDDDTTEEEQAYSSSGEDVGRDHIPTASALKSTYTPPPENSLLAQIGDMATFMNWYCKKQGISELTQKDLEGPAYEIVKIEEECKYDVAAMYGISHWWFQRQRFYIDRHTSEGDRRAVRTHMRILSVVRIEVFPMYGYNYMKKIVLRRADLKEYVIVERDFKYLYPSDFKDLYLLNLQGHLNHLSPEDKKILTTAVNLWTRNLVIRQRVEDFQLGIESYQTQLNLTKPRWDAKGFEYKHDFTVIDSPRAVTFRDKYGVQMIMRFNEIHKFSDGTLHQIDEALDYRVKEFRVNRRNPGLDTRFWMKKDIDRSKEFMFSIQK
ncbi:hypothetical protein Tco_0015217 [Tanacetum coccineum]